VAILLFENLSGKGLNFTIPNYFFAQFNSKYDAFGFNKLKA
jgi:hypothetical protein